MCQNGFGFISRRHSIPPADSWFLQIPEHRLVEQSFVSKIAADKLAARHYGHELLNQHSILYDELPLYRHTTRRNSENWFIEVFGKRWETRMAKKAEKKTSKKRGPAKAAKKTPKGKKTAKTAGKTAAVKTATRKVATKTTTVKKASKKKLPAKVARKVTNVTSISRTKRAVKPTGLRPKGPATRKQSIRHPAQPAQPAAAAHKPAASISPQPAPAFEAAEAFTHQGADMAEGFQPGQRVRHRYEHWWGTIVQKADSSGNSMAAPAPVRYVVAVDGGMNRDDIRPEDLTVS